MSLIDRLMLRDSQETARAEAMREFNKVMPRSGRISELERSRITGYYDKRFGGFDPSLDRWEEGHASVLKANPLLRRIDIVADSVFSDGRFSVHSAGDVRSERDESESDGLVGAIVIHDRVAKRGALLILDIGSEIRFSRLRIGTSEGSDLIVRLSTLDLGMAMYPGSANPGEERMERVNQRAPEGSRIFHTLAETIKGIRDALGMKGRESADPIKISLDQGTGHRLGEAGS